MQRQLGTRVLKEVSRSFYLTLRLLPKGFREPTSVAYLLARASDTLADSEGWTDQERIGLLMQFKSVMQESDSAESFCQKIEVEKVENLKERELLIRLREVFLWMEDLPSWQQEAIQTVVITIIEGQLWDVRYFDREGYTRVATEEELTGYTYAVAGCVGEFWTALGFGLKGDRYAQLDQKEMMVLGKSYGQGLQLVNILRDMDEDGERGRCYLPGEGKLEGAKGNSVYKKWLEEAEECLRQGEAYAKALESWRMRGTTILPARLGLKTIDLLKSASPEERRKGVKISRKVVREELWQAFIS